MNEVPLQEECTVPELCFNQPRSCRSLRMFELPPYKNIGTYHAYRLALLFEAFNLLHATDPDADPDVGPCLGPYGGPRQGGVFI